MSPLAGALVIIVIGIAAVLGAAAIFGLADVLSRPRGADWYTG